MKNGDTRIDISNLITPLLKAIKWYVMDGDERAEMDGELADNIHAIASFAIRGLHKLQNSTYRTDKNIRILLQYFINLLRDALAGSWNDDNIVKLEGENGLLSDKIKNNYDGNAINSIGKMFRDADAMDKSQKDIDAIIDCIHKMLMNRDDNFVKIMKDVNTNL